jgi:hypothetical protein
MALEIDPDAAAYGIFQIAFATMDTRLSRALAALCRCKRTKFTFAILSREPFGRRLATLRKAVKTAMLDLQNDPDIEELEKACDLAQKVQQWRNSRTHAEVRFAENRPVLIDEYGKPLQIDRDVCEQKIREAMQVGIAMEAAVPHLVAYEMDIEELSDEP